MKVTFYGVRGSCPCPSKANRRYGGNTACVTLEVGDEPPIILDLGTGLRDYGMTQPLDGSFRASALVTHIHWDHIQGLPFFPPADRAGAVLDVYAPAQEDSTLAEAIDDLMRPPYFPVRCSELRGAIRFHEVGDAELALGNAKVTVRRVPHVGPTVGYRVEWGGKSVAYISDHQAPLDLSTVAEGVLELVDGADLLVHDAQFTAQEFKEKSHWGHCTIDFAADVAKAGGAECLALFHHDPAHDDDTLDELLNSLRRYTGSGGLRVLSAYDGLVIEL